MIEKGGRKMKRKHTKEERRGTASTRISVVGRSLLMRSVSQHSFLRRGNGVGGRPKRGNNKEYFRGGRGSRYVAELECNKKFYSLCPAPLLHCDV